MSGYSIVKNRKAVPVPPAERHDSKQGEPEEGHSPVGECVFSTGYLPSRISCNLSISGCSLEWFFCSAMMKNDAKLPITYSQNRHCPSSFRYSPIVSYFACIAFSFAGR
ncbi:hypothetical protein PO399_21960 [Bacteroides ovatus]|nr:hypothetical protein [Bacteroides ovatus]MDC2709272.1 hypothetical protein [Bacteroides ovatus]MDC2718506.1 hypothetical protein [Bacteroides ovatus]